MQIPGKLEATTLGDVLGTLYRAQVTGSLVLTDAWASAHRVRLSVGRPSGVQTSLHTPKLGELLLRQRSDVRLRRAIEGFAFDPPAQPLGKCLLEHALVSAEELTRALAEQTRERLEAVYQLKRATLRVMLRDSDWVVSNSSPLPPESFLHGRPRATRVASAEPEPQVFTRNAALRLLGFVGAEPAPAEIRRAFRQLAARLHPDRWASAEVSVRAARTAAFAQLTAAYHSLLV